GACKTAYQLAGHADRYSSALFPCPHGFCPLEQVDAIRWFFVVFFGKVPPEADFALRKAPALGFEQVFTRLNGEMVPIEVANKGTNEWAALQVGSLPDDGGKPAILRIIEERRQDAARARATPREPDQLTAELSRCLGIDKLEFVGGAVGNAK